MSKEHKVTIKEIVAVTRDVGCFVTTKPDGFDFRPGQATNVAIAKDEWRDQKRPFTFTSLPEDPFLEFTIKIYPERDGVTDRLAELEVGEELIIGEPWGAIEYRKPGTFIAGGAGVTPFISILRDLQKSEQLEGNRLLFSNETESDVILAGEFRKMLGEDVIYTVTGEESATYKTGRIDKEFLSKQIKDFDQHFYVCGPPEMVEDVMSHLTDLGADKGNIVHEEAA